MIYLYFSNRAFLKLGNQQSIRFERRSISFSQHIISYALYYARISFQQPYVSSFILSPWCTPPPHLLRFIELSLLTIPILFFHRGPFFFFTRPPLPLYTHYAYILQLVVKHRASTCLSFPFAEWVTTTPFGHERYHGLWASRGLYRLAINRREITIEIRNTCPRVKVAYERWHLGIARFTVFM